MITRGSADETRRALSNFHTGTVRVCELHLARRMSSQLRAAAIIIARYCAAKLQHLGLLIRSNSGVGHFETRPYPRVACSNVAL